MKTEKRASSPSFLELKMDTILRYGTLILVVLQTTATVLLLRYSRTREGTPYLASTAVFISEILKFIVCIGSLLAQNCKFLDSPKFAKVIWHLGVHFIKLKHHFWPFKHRFWPKYRQFKRIFLAFKMPCFLAFKMLISVISLLLFGVSNAKSVLSNWWFEIGVWMPEFGI